MADKVYIALDDRELATVLVALRSFQLDMQNGEFRAREMEHLDFEPLNDTEIDALCERLNCGEELAACGKTRL